MVVTFTCLSTGYSWVNSIKANASEEIVKVHTKVDKNANDIKYIEKQQTKYEIRVDKKLDSMDKKLDLLLMERR